MRCLLLTLTGLALGGLLPSSQSYGQTAEEARLASAGAVLNAFTVDPATAIPSQLLQQAQGIAIIPRMIRVGFIFGGHRGKGIVVVRSDNGEWSNPSFITLTGGSFGAQIGAESADLILVFGNEISVRTISEGKFTVGSDASATAGPVGRNLAVTRDRTFASELYTYVRSRGLFAGATIQGAKLGVDHAANRNFYSPGGEAQPLTATTFATSDSARRFLTTLYAAETLSRGSPESTVEDNAGEDAITYPLGAGAN
ncbi:MAG: lipid-binding SYLF domain-containing protein [Gammaproteobacteria bacterium]|nr:lipid-binding SYLF domain-containing protein [Gammaproteobacteria bacterium]